MTLVLQLNNQTFKILSLAYKIFFILIDYKKTKRKKTQDWLWQEITQ